MLVNWIIRASKSTLAVEIARALDKLSIPCERLDGDIIHELSKGLGFFSRRQKYECYESWVCLWSVE